MKLYITGGTYRGQSFTSPSGNRTHPMSARARLALFNMLGDLSGLTVLDAFSGSGALAFESLSRRASYAYAIEIDPKAYRTITENVESIGFKNIKVSRANITTWLASNNVDFDVLFCDPPYHHVNLDIILSVARRLKPGGLLVCSLPPFVEINELEEAYTLLRSKKYARANIYIFKN